MVEMAIAAPFLVFVFFAIAEFAVMAMVQSELTGAARESVRLAAAGLPPALCETRSRSNTQRLTAAQLTVQFEYAPYVSAGTWSATWTALGTTNDGAANTAPLNAKIRCTTGYTHQLLIPGLTGQVVLCSAQGETQMQAVASMTRG
jgi:Flp pilus assembly protein TadG